MAPTRRRGDREHRDAHDPSIPDLARLAGSPLDVDAMLERATALVARLTNADRASLFLLDRSGDLLVPSALVGMDDEFTRAWKLRPLRIADEPLSREAIETRSVVVIEDARRDPRTDKGMVGFFGDQSILVAPLIANWDRPDRTLGTLFVNHVKAPHRFTRRDIDTMEAVAAQVSILLENARLSGVTRRLASQLRRSFQVAGDTLALATAETSNLPGILQQLLDLAIELVDAEGGTVSVLDDFARGTEIVASSARHGHDPATSAHGGDATAIRDTVKSADRPGGGGVANVEAVPIPGLSQRGSRTRDGAEIVAPFSHRSMGGGTSTGSANVDRWTTHPTSRSDDDIAEDPGAIPGTTNPGFPLGALTVWRDDTPFGLDARALLATIASYAGVAIEQRRLAYGVANERARREAAERSQAEFLSMVTHELRTPLALIAGYAATLRRRDIMLPEATVLRFHEGIGDATDRLARLIDNLLTSSALEAGHFVARPEPLDLVEVVLGAASAITVLDLARPVTVEIAERPLPVTGDPDLLALVVQNLVGNARKYTAPGLPVRIILSARPGWVRVSVADTGPGIPSDAIDRIFDKFFRVSIDDGDGMPGGKGPPSPLSRGAREGQGEGASSGQPSGLGLGLFICRQITSAHRGRIWAENIHAPGDRIGSRPVGAKFIIEIPRAV